MEPVFHGAGSIFFYDLDELPVGDHQLMADHVLLVVDGAVSPDIRGLYCACVLNETGVIEEVVPKDPRLVQIHLEGRTMYGVAEHYDGKFDYVITLSYDEKAKWLVATCYEGGAFQAEDRQEQSRWVEPEAYPPTPWRHVSKEEKLSHWIFSFQHDVTEVICKMEYRRTPCELRAGPHVFPDAKSLRIEVRINSSPNNVMVYGVDLFFSRDRDAFIGTFPDEEIWESVIAGLIDGHAGLYIVY